MFGNISRILDKLPTTDPLDKRGQSDIRTGESSIRNVGDSHSVLNSPTVAEKSVATPFPGGFVQALRRVVFGLDSGRGSKDPEEILKDGRKFDPNSEFGKVVNYLIDNRLASPDDALNTAEKMARDEASRYLSANSPTWYFSNNIMKSPLFKDGLAKMVNPDNAGTTDDAYQIYMAQIREQLDNPFKRLALISDYKESGYDVDWDSIEDVVYGRAIPKLSKRAAVKKNIANAYKEAR